MSLSLGVKALVSEMGIHLEGSMEIKSDAYVEIGFSRQIVLVLVQRIWRVI